MGLKITTLLLLLTLFISGCAPDNAPLLTNTITPGFIGTLRIYQTETFTPTATPPLHKSPTPTATATPTPTPVTYTVRAKDDMFGIAYAFGISPQALMTANPTVDPRAMSIGTILIIPVTPPPEDETTTPTITPTPTPAIAVILRPPDCYPAKDGSLWCFLLVKNNLENGLENVTAKIDLAVPGQKDPIEANASTLLDLLPGGQTAPLVAYFPAPVPTGVTASGAIISGLPQPIDDLRYLSISLQDQQVSIANDGKTASISVAVSLPPDSPSATQLWIAATAFSADGAVVGVRKWESPGPLEAGKALKVDFAVYSLGGTIDHVSLQAEARP